MRSLSSFFVCLVCLVLCLTTFGCGGGSSGPSGPDPTAVSVSATTANGLTATLAQERATVSPDTTITYTLTLTNNTAAPVTFKTQTIETQSMGKTAIPLAYLQVFDDEGRVVRPGFSYDDTVPPAETTLAPGQSLTRGEFQLPYLETSPQWNHFRGRYQAFATFTVDGADTRVGPLVVTVR